MTNSECILLATKIFEENFTKRNLSYAEIVEILRGLANILEAKILKKISELESELENGSPN